MTERTPVEVTVAARLSETLNVLGRIGGKDLEESLEVAARAMHRLLDARLTLLLAPRQGNRSSDVRCCLSEGPLCARLRRPDSDLHPFVPGVDVIPTVAVDPDELAWVAMRRKCAVLPTDGSLQEQIGLSATVVIPLSGMEETYGVIACWTTHDDLATSAWVPDLLFTVASQFAMTIERERVQRGTHRAVSLLDNLLENTPIAMLAVDDQERILEINRSASFLFGLSRIDAVDERYSDLLPASAAGPMAALATASLGDGGIHEDAFALTLPDGTPLQISVSVAPLVDRDGKRTGVMFHYRDLSNEQELRQLHERQEGNLGAARALVRELQSAIEEARRGLTTVGGPDAASTSDPGLVRSRQGVERAARAAAALQHRWLGDDGSGRSSSGN